MKRVPFSFYFFLFLLLFVYVGDFIYTTSPFEIRSDSVLLAPSFEHFLGTDRLGRDVLARIIEGGKSSLTIGIISALIATLLGAMVGISAGYFKGVVDKGIVVLIDLFLTFPTFFLLLALVSYIDASAIVLILVISVTGWMGTARLIRSEAFGISKKPYIKVLKLGGVKNYKIFFKYFLPLLAPIFLISLAFGISGAILAESGLSFLGLGVQPPNVSLGSMLEDGKEVLDIAWWVSFFPGLLIFMLTYTLVKIADYLQGIFNKKSLN